MIDRRYPIQTVLANRKMFAGGGVVSPQQTAAPVQPSMGILSSSAPLMEAVAADAVNPAGGSTMVEAAEFSNGGAVQLPPTFSVQQPTQGTDDPYTSDQIPSLTPIMNVNDPRLMAVSPLYRLPGQVEGAGFTVAPVDPIGMTEEGLSGETDSERLQRLFPVKFASPGRQDLERDSSAGRDDRSRIGAFVLGAAEKGINAVRSFASETGQDLAAIADTFLADAESELPRGMFGDPDSVDLDMARRRRTVMEMIQRRPDLKDDIIAASVKVLNKNKDIVANLNARDTGNPILGANDFAQAIAAEISKDQEFAPKASTELDESSPEDDLDRTAREQAFQDPTGPDPEEKSFVDLFEGDVAKGLIDSEEAKDGPSVTKADRNTAEEQAALVEGDAFRGAPVSEIERNRALEGVREAAKTATDKEGEAEVERNMAYYLEQFKNAMPKYEGMSDSEKGYAIMEAGLKIMAGQSEHALVNIAEGLKGLGPQFAKDDKDRRAWNRQVDLSAAKYALENRKADRNRAFALAKERRARVEYVANKPGTDARTGREFSKGDVLTFTAGEIHDGVLDNFAPGTVILPKTFSDIQKGIAAQNKLLTAGRIKYADYRKDRTLYQKASKNLISGLQMKLLMGDAAKIIRDDPGNVLGATGFIQKATDSVFNTLGVHTKEEREKYLKKVGSGSGGELGKGKEFDALMRQISTKMITQILNEGNRTVSDNDRKRVDELVGAYADYLSNVPGSLATLRIKMDGLATSIDQGILESQAAMGDIESEYNNRLEADRYKRLQQYKAARFGNRPLQSRTGYALKLGKDGVYRRIRMES